MGWINDKKSNLDAIFSLSKQIHLKRVQIKIPAKVSREKDYYMEIDPKISFYRQKVNFGIDKWKENKDELFVAQLDYEDPKLEGVNAKYYDYR